MLIVKKFGGSSVADKERIFNVAKRCIEDYEAGNDVVVVLSAMGKTTDRLIEMARDINPKASKREMDMLLATGEQTSVALMSMAMQSLGVSDSGRGRVDVPGRVVVPGRDVSGRVDVLGRDVPGRVVDEPGREELPGRVGALCGRVEVFGRNRTEPKSERR